MYAPIFNHVKEHHLDGAALLNGAKIDENMRRMGVVVMGAERSRIVNVKRADRDKALLGTLHFDLTTTRARETDEENWVIDLISSTLGAGHSVMMPSDPSARLLELLVLLEMHWTRSNLSSFPLCLISRTGKDVVSFVRSLTEWMGGQVNADERGEKLLKFM